MNLKKMLDDFLGKNEEIDLFIDIINKNKEYKNNKNECEVRIDFPTIGFKEETFLSFDFNLN